MTRRRAIAAALTFPLVAGAQQGDTLPNPRSVASVATDSLGTRPPRSATAAQGATRAWYERLTLRGYAQLRYNRLFESDRSLTCPCDRSIGNNNGFFLRRARLVLSGDVHDRVSIYIQPDYSADAAGAALFFQIRDAYFDVALDRGRTFRLRFGHSKVPFGFETLQSSSQRIPLDRGEGINSGVSGERDLGVIAMWTPPSIRARFRALADSGLKGTGDYGVIAAGIYNGQTANRPEANNNLHGVVRAAYPFALPKNQVVELGAHAYTGRFVVTTRSPNVTSPFDLLDQRAGASFVLYPRPFGVLAEWNGGTGPEFNATTRRIEERHLAGGHLTLSYRARPRGQMITPYARVQSYDGGRKVDVDARRHRIREVEAGIEWLPISAFELTAAYYDTSRLTEDGAQAATTRENRSLRLQVQINY